MTAAIRLSPSGPTLKNDDGGILKPGSGMVLRQDKLMSETDPSNRTVPEVPTAAAEIQFDMSNPTSAHTLRPELEQTQGALRYTVKGEFDLSLGNGWTTATIQANVEVTRDDGASWHQVNQQDMSINARGGTGGTQHFVAESVPFAGNTIPNYVEGDTIAARVTVQQLGASGADASIESTGTNGAASVVLTETL